MDWHPNGKFIAIPIENQVHVYERDSWDQTFAFGGEDGHSKPVAMAVWSPNGEYIASVSTHGEILVWETQTKQSLGRFKHKEGLAISSISWHPEGNAIVWADMNGKFSVWKEPVPEASQFAAPTGGDEVRAHSPTPPLRPSFVAAPCCCCTRWRIANSIGTSRALAATQAAARRVSQLPGGARAHGSGSSGLPST